MGDTQKVPKMLYVVIGVIKDDDQLIRGYRLFNLVTNKVLDVPSEKIQQGISNILGVRWDTTYKGLVSTCEVNISDLPVIDMKKRSLRARGGILIKELVVDDLGAKVRTSLVLWYMILMVREVLYPMISYQDLLVNRLVTLML